MCGVIASNVMVRHMIARRGLWNQTSRHTVELSTSGVPNDGIVAIAILPLRGVHE